MKEYDLFVPLYYNDGTPVERRKLREIQKRLLSKFGGLTFFPQPSQGFWTSEDVTYRDEIVVYRVLAPQTRAARRFLTQLKEELKENSSRKKS